MKKNIYKSTITVMLCLLFFMQKDILAAGSTMCVSTSVYQDRVLSQKKPSSQNGSLQITFYNQKTKKPITCNYLYNSSCQLGNTCTLNINTPTDQCPASFKGALEPVIKRWWTFKTKDILTSFGNDAKTVQLVSVMWTPTKQPELSTKLHYDSSPSIMPLIHLATDTTRLQQVYIEDKTTPANAECQYLCTDKTCTQNICESTELFDINTTMGILIRPAERASPGIQCGYSLNKGFVPAPGASPSTIEQCKESSQPPPNPNASVPMYAVMFKESIYGEISIYSNQIFNTRLMDLDLSVEPEASKETTPVMILTKPTQLITDKRKILFALPQAYKHNLPLKNWCNPYTLQ